MTRTLLYLKVIAKPQALVCCDLPGVCSCHLPPLGLVSSLQDRDELRVQIHLLSLSGEDSTHLCACGRGLRTALPRDAQLI